MNLTLLQALSGPLGSDGNRLTCCQVVPQGQKEPQSMTNSAQGLSLVVSDSSDCSNPNNESSIRSLETEELLQTDTVQKVANNVMSKKDIPWQSNSTLTTSRMDQSQDTLDDINSNHSTGRESECQAPFSEQENSSQNERQRSIVQTHQSSFCDAYDLGETLGRGAFGNVRRCFIKTAFGTSRRDSLCSVSTADKRAALAVKSISLRHVCSHGQLEIEILQLLRDCPSIVQLQDVYHDTDATHIVMEEMVGGDLLSRLRQKEVYTEEEARCVMKTLLKSVQYCHSRGVAHLDIKPENILLQYDQNDENYSAFDKDTTVKLADFGLAKILSRTRLTEICGSPEYTAPEVFRRWMDEDYENDSTTYEYDERCDIWSCGIVMYLLLGGYLPFRGEGQWEIVKKATKGVFKFHDKFWANISEDAKLLILGMLQVSPDDRITLDKALCCSWFDQ